MYFGSSGPYLWLGGVLVVVGFLATLVGRWARARYEGKTEDFSWLTIQGIHRLMSYDFVWVSGLIAMGTGAVIAFLGLLAQGQGR